MLEFDHPATLGLHIRDVLHTVLSWMDNLLPADRKLSFPGAVPLGLVLPPRVTDATSLVSPVPNPNFSALSNHRVTATRTLARKIGLSLLALSMDASKFHITTYVVAPIRGLESPAESWRPDLWDRVRVRLDLLPSVRQKGESDP